MSHTIVALTGFLGQSKDWTDVIPNALVLENLPLLAFWELADFINEQALKLPEPRLLAGYSLGGRLALHALLRAPKIWDQAVILSAHTGLKEPEARAKRLSEDLLWGEKFQKQEWKTLTKEWNQRGALKTSLEVNRLESDYNRAYLAASLDLWSLARQEDLKELIEDVQIPILWMTGEFDFSFCQIAKSLHFKSIKSRKVIVPQSGHRILNDKRTEVIKEWPWKRI